nr:C25 family cysteine peptidase [Vicinamibacterales bacterium]
MQKLTTASIVTSICLHLASAGPLAAQQPSNLVRPGDRVVRFTVTLPDSALRVDAIDPPVDPATGAAEGDPVTRVDLDGVGAVSRPDLPGQADLPSLVRLVAVPRTARIVALRVVPRETREIANVALVTWAQTPRPGQVVPQRDPAEPPPPSEAGPWYSPGPPDPMPAGYLDAERWPAEPARAIDVRRAGAVGVAQVEITPLEWRPREGRLLFHRAIDVELVTRGGRFPERVSNFAQAESIRLLAATVVNPGVLPEVPANPPAGPQRFPYVIVTDNVTWNARAIQPLLPVPGDIVGELQALANWRTKTGLNAKVVTVSDIVNGAYGNFRQPSDPDLQAVIRRFLQFAQREWGTYYVLLGGGVGIVPTRIVTTAAAGNGAWWNFKYVGPWPLINLLPPIEAGQCVYVTGDMAILRQDASLPVQDSTLLIANGQGLALARVSSPTPNAPGWTYLASDLSESAVPTEYILVRAPAQALGETNLMAQTSDTEIPTDFYYASLGTTPAGRWLQQQFPWLPDWDVNGNGIYGQAAFGFDVD